MIAKAIDKINAEQVAKFKAPEFTIGDSVKVYVKIKEGGKERKQAFIGTVIAMDNGKGVSATFTVRRYSFGIGVEKIFPVYSPYIDHVEIDHSAKVRRAKLYYLRKLTGKKARLHAITKKPSQKAAAAPAAPAAAEAAAEAPAAEAPAQA